MIINDKQQTVPYDRVKRHAYGVVERAIPILPWARLDILDQHPPSIRICTCLYSNKSAWDSESDLISF